MCPGSLFPPQLAAEAAHHRCMLVDRGPYSRTGTADENKDESWFFNCAFSDKLPQRHDNKHDGNIRQPFAVLSHVQDVAVVVFRKGALCPGTGPFLLDVDVLPIQTQRMSNAPNFPRQQLNNPQTKS